jgi:hypothetical protein
LSYGFAGRVSEFKEVQEDALIGRILEGVASTGVDAHRNAQIEAWRKQVQILHDQLTDAEFRDWFLVIEYEIARRSRRPDVILLHGGTIFILEFKVGAATFDSIARWQVHSYALDLRDFHFASRGRVIVPVLCATNAPTRLTGGDIAIRAEGGVTGVVLACRENLGSRLLGAAARVERCNPEIEPECWLNAPYRPTPSIIEAAVQLYEGHAVRELSHRYAHNLDRTTEMLVGQIRRAREERKRVVCFVTGIPGAGKTLTGLDVVHDPELSGQSASAGIFLSGNGPLVKVVREALVLNQASKGKRRRDSEHEVGTFIQNVHQFLRHYREHSDQCPHEHVIVFDEAQRAWNAEQMARKQHVSVSEAAELLDVMERFTEWAVVIALVGGGQEIYMGEAGLGEWGRTIAERAERWEIVASPDVIVGGESVANHRLFEGQVPSALTVREEPLAHLAVGVRSHRAQLWAEWVNEFLELRLEASRALVPDASEFPCLLTRDLERAREWLRAMWSTEPSYRTGLLSTSEDQRLRAYGIEPSSAFRSAYPFHKWFLSPPNDVRSSFALEVAASEFECQGLELDWVGLCWGADFTLDASSSHWDYRKFRGASWQSVRRPLERAYVLNRYRVLLTRARRGMVIWVPRGSSDDATRDPARFDRVYQVLMEAGLPALEEVFPQ